MTSNLNIDSERVRPQDNLTVEETALYELMSEISEDCWCAGWMSGNEYALWSALQDGELKYGMGAMDRELLSQVAALSVMTGSWIVWRDESHGLPMDEWGPYAIPLSEWFPIYDSKNDLRTPLPPPGESGELAKLREDAARLDFVLKNQAFICRIDATMVQLMAQNEDEEFIELSGEGEAFRTEREAIDAAMGIAALPHSMGKGAV